MRRGMREVELGSTFKGAQRLLLLERKDLHGRHGHRLRGSRNLHLGLLRGRLLGQGRFCEGIRGRVTAGEVGERYHHGDACVTHHH